MNATDSNSENLGVITEREIYEIPETLKIALGQTDLISKIAEEIIARPEGHIYLIGAGTSYHAGFAISYMLNGIAKVPTFTEFSQEFQYLIEPILKKDDIVIGISQSGETKDAIESIKISKKLGCLTVGITNFTDSSLAKVCDYIIPLKCEEEKSVLATKTYISELAILALLSLEIALKRGVLSQEDYKMILDEMYSIPAKISTILPVIHKDIKKYSHYFKFAEFCFILGGGPDYATAMEASLKLKEGARVFGQAYSTAEFPHGPITLADSKAWVIAIIPHEEDLRKKNIINLLNRLKERKTTVLGIYSSTDEPESIDFGLQVPSTYKDLQPMLSILGVQLLTLEIARIKDINCDTPKFLSKVSGV